MFKKIIETAGKRFDDPITKQKHISLSSYFVFVCAVQGIPSKRDVVVYTPSTNRVQRNCINLVYSERAASITQSEPLLNHSFRQRLQPIFVIIFVGVDVLNGDRNSNLRPRNMNSRINQVQIRKLSVYSLVCNRDRFKIGVARMGKLYRSLDFPTLQRKRRRESREPGMVCFEP